MNLSENFTQEELTWSTTARRLGLDNTPPDDILANLTATAGGLEQVRALLGNHPIHIDSGYRCPELNKAVGGATNSAHMKGYAADFVCPDFGSPMDIVTALVASDIAFDKCIMEGTWVHISFDPQARRQAYKAYFGQNGTTYTAWS